ncbi:hypothetical protein [Sphingosinicella rhizophila]|uniref:Uncharacterized protein n=1 Tax=Sphingosinicella rhizophila TaxID=3050082 RepID=A0ABU3QAN9_9SPHN|nr:hypothetical protein [Sphingosinicella sp. GR2756]MDT9600010.1 hypothetical protein [Sphingosinicella sp. GR2756]
MWWKLGGLLVLTAALVIGVIPIRTHAVLYDPAKSLPPPMPSLGEMFSTMYLTPGTALLISVILAAAGFVALKIIRGQR